LALALGLGLVAAATAAAGGGTALYAPVLPDTADHQPNSDTHTFMTEYDHRRGAGNTPGLDFLVGGASSSDESSLLESAVAAAAVTAAAAGLAGAAGFLTAGLAAA